MTAQKHGSSMRVTSPATDSGPRPVVGAGGARIGLHVLLCAVALLGLLVAPNSAVAHTGVQSPSADNESQALPYEDPARGLVYEGLEPGRTDGPCEGLFEIRSDTGELVGCTHGPDPAPEGVDVREPRSIEDFAAEDSAEPMRDFSNQMPGVGGPTPPVPCVDTDTSGGTAGNRVQAIYAYTSDRPGGSRADQWVPIIRRFAARVNRDFYDSSKETDGVRFVRFVTEENCQLAVDVVELPPNGDDDFGETTWELRKLGEKYRRPDRKYLIWMDPNRAAKSTFYCGIGEMKRDANPGQDNLSNGHKNVEGLIARIDIGCWGTRADGGSTEAHELMHNLGGVQKGAPNATANGHCIDEFDRMCYDDDKDAPGISDGFVRIPCFSLFGCWENKEMVYKAECPASHERLFDCGHDDYFHTSPPSGNWLATNWNTANSNFLIKNAAVWGNAHISNDPAAPEVTAPEYVLRDEQGSSGVRIKLWWKARDLGLGLAAHHLWVQVDGGAWSQLTLPAGQGLGFTGSTWVWGWANTSLTPGRTYRFAVIVVDAANNPSTWAFSDNIRFEMHDESSGQITYSGNWSTVSSSDYASGAAKRTNTGGSEVKLSFLGNSVAWVGTLSPSGGDADVFLDGAPVGRLSQTYGLTRFRQVLYDSDLLPPRPTDFFGFNHTLTIRAVGGGQIDVDRFIVGV